jgi:uroporphyrinogen decarboxylase
MALRSTMDSKERVLAAIGHERTDRPPRGEIVIDDSVVESFLRCERVAFEERREFVTALGLDLVCMAPALPLQPEGAILPDPSQANWGDMDEWAGRTDRFVFAMVDGAFGWGIRLWGFQKFLVALVKGATGLTDLFKAVEDLNRALVREARDRGANAILLADDIAYQQGLMANPELLRRHVLPSLTRQAQSFKAMNLPVFFHSDGNLNDIIDDLIETGLDGLQCIESAAGMDLTTVRERYGDHLCLWGNLDPAYLTSSRTREEIFQEVHAILNAAGNDDGFIFGTSSGLFRGVKRENLAWVHEALETAR